MIDLYLIRNPVRILRGQFAGIEYYYGVVSLPSDEGEVKVLQFEYEVALNETGIDVENHPAFHNLIGDILVDLIEINCNKET